MVSFFWKFFMNIFTAFFAIAYAGVVYPA
jgi:hypothetical protein